LLEGQQSGSEDIIDGKEVLSRSESIEVMTDFIQRALGFACFEFGMTPICLESAADDNRVLWKTFNAHKSTSVMLEQVGQELLAATGLGDALGITYSKPVVPKVIDCVLGFSAERNSTSFRGRTINLTPATLQGAF
jgi:hypothetical protein